MANKSTKKPASKPIKHKDITKEEYLEILIRFSKRAITKQGSGVDDYFTQQAARLEKQLKELRSAK